MLENVNFQYSLRIVGFRDGVGRHDRRFPHRPFSIPCESWGSATTITWLLITGLLISFSIPCESWGSATPTKCRQRLGIFSFSIPCESWGSATHFARQVFDKKESLSVFPANRGVPRQDLDVFCTNSKLTFQYSLRIVGFRDNGRITISHRFKKLSVFPANRGVPRLPDTILSHPEPRTFSIPCESWGSATIRTSGDRDRRFCFQYSLRIVGFRDITRRWTMYTIDVDFQYSLRIVGFRDTGDRFDPVAFLYSFSIPCESWGSATGGDQAPLPPHRLLSVFPANRGVPRPRPRRQVWRVQQHFQYSLRIVGFRDGFGPAAFPFALSPFSIPCESWGSATGDELIFHRFLILFQYSLRIVGFRDTLELFSRYRRL